MQDQQHAAHSPGSEETGSLLSRNLSLQQLCRGLLNIAGAIYTRKHLIGVAGAITVVIGAFLLWRADQLLCEEGIAYELISPLTWLIALAGIAAGIIACRPHSGKFIMITGICLAAYALFTFWDLPYTYSTPSTTESWKGWCHGGIIATLLGGCLLWYTGLLTQQFNWSRYLKKHLSWRAFFSFGVNARIRVYCYLAVLLFFAFNCAIGAISIFVRQAISTVIDQSLLKEAVFRQNAICHTQAISLKNRIIDVSRCNADVHISGNNEQALLAKTGLTKTQLQQLSDQHSLTPLVTAALKLHCLPEEVTTIVKDPYTKSPAAICTELRQANAKRARELYLKEADQYWREVDPYLTLRFVRPEEYRRASLWKEGWDRFIDEGKGLIRAAEELVPNPLCPDNSVGKQRFPWL